MTFYDEMADLVTEILSDPDFKQGVVYLVQVTEAAPDPSTPWLPGVETTQTYELDSVTRQVDEKYIDNSTIFATDKQVTFAVPPVEPTPDDRLQIDGTIFEIKRLIRIPGAGTPVAYSVIVSS